MLIAGSLILLALSEAPSVVRKSLVTALLLSLLLFAILLGLIGIFRALLRNVGTRLFFSYLLIGPLPLLLTLTLGGLAGYALVGLLTSHLAEDARRAVARDLEMQLAHLTAAARPNEDPLVLAKYHHGKRVSGSGLLPDRFPSALVERNPASGSSLALLADGSVGLAAWRCNVAAEQCLLAVLNERLEEEVRRRSGLWVDYLPPGDPRRRTFVRIQIGGVGFVFRGLRLRPTAQQQEAFYRISPPQAQPPDFLDQPWLLWADETNELVELATGDLLPEGLAVAYAASPRGLLRGFEAGTARIDAGLWLALLSIGVAFAQIAIVAGFIAASLIFGLSRAVNRLTLATAAIARGDFSVRIGSRRRDQLGELARSFDRMAAEIQALVHTRAEKEALDRELALARQVQESLLPVGYELPPEFRLETRFVPSAALGGDLYDLRKLREGRIVFLIADVSGHGLAASLRTAFVRAAFALLIDEGRSPEEALARMDRELRERGLPRAFVTALVATLDPTTGSLEFTSAGHPPAYLVRNSGEVEEYTLTSAPLGTLDFRVGKAAATLEPGDSLVLLSDGWIEATNEEEEPFGYERVLQALRGGPAAARTVAARLEAEVERHTQGARREDDCTLLVVERLLGEAKRL